MFNQMVPDLTLEVVYLNQPTDFKMEFDLCAAGNVRFLSAITKTKNEFLSALSKSVSRSRVIVTVGSFNPLDSEYLPKIVANATGYILKPVDKSKFQIVNDGELLLPDTALPVVDFKGNLAGSVLESNDQSIIMLSSNREHRHNVLGELVIPYITMFASKKSTIIQTAMENNEQAPAEQVELKNDDVQPKQDALADSDEAIVEQPKQEKNEDFILETSTDNEQSEKATVPEQSLDEKNQPKEEQLEPFVQLLGIDLEPEKAKEPSPQPAEGYTVLEQPENTVSKFNLEDFLSEPEEEPKKHRKRGIFKIIIAIILVISVLISAFFGYEFVFQPMQKASIYEDMLELYGQTWDGLPSNMLYKFGRLYQTNKDVYGWLKIPETDINLPVVSTQNKSAAYYQTHLFDGSVNRYGTLYTTSALSENFTRNIVIYGKDVYEGQMLSNIKKYLDIEHYRKAPTFTFDTVYLEGRYKVFSVFKVADALSSHYTKTYFFDDAEFESYLKALNDISLIKTSIDVTANDEIVTLALQTEGKDVFVVARRVRDGESPLVDITEADVNEAPIMSSEIPTLAKPGLTEISSMEPVSSEDKSMADGASSRYEQQAPISSAIQVKPSTIISSTPPNLKPSSAKPSSNTGTSKKPTSTVTSKKPTTTSNTVTSSPSSTVTPQGKLPTLCVTNNYNGKNQKVSGPANEILAQIIEAEMGSGYPLEALKAQAVAAYSWLICSGSAAGKYPSLPMKTAGAKAKEAANAVAGQVAVYGGNVAQTYFYAISAGYSANKEDIWGYDRIPYLVSVDSSVDKSVNGFQTIRKYKASDVAKWVKESLNVDLNTITNKSNWFKCTYDQNGLYVKTVKIGTVNKQGRYLRETIFISARVGSKNVLRSSAYTIEYDAAQDEFVFTVKGYGHGIGMSQTGAKAYAEKGYDYEWILKHYFKGISLGTYYTK
ncbi:MAG: SpoIID/LytB domain-containing protein [Clostridia bacterium]|nr:SpoIID/LytB domain-containing protein [Clostridia bacterium]